ncbi:hypothetical protein B5F40_12185 [Gordonibacter sp. An230]|uniref:DUF2975 domain-containing protein n=1 Tax=Gordonibacter sp. An230 TaxID=1965592 RepID=UPI000B3A68C7|nr:DUF2975 domain-containing protein [Gordonibacter sp. An230]OUO88612.1 hypothetical protein B5F40_12185 [Gordonibacter sp. An230]
MLDVELEEANNSLQKTRKICNCISVGLKVVFGLICIYWILVVGAMLLSMFNPGLVIAQDGRISFFSILLYLAYGFIIASLFVVFISIFSNTAKGETPFAMSQVKRLRIIAALLLLYAILDMVATNAVAVMQIDIINSGYISTNSAIVTVNFTPFIAAAVVYAFSFVFKYGVLLQEFSDETL